MKNVERQLLACWRSSSACDFVAALADENRGVARRRLRSTLLREDQLRRRSGLVLRLPLWPHVRASSSDPSKTVDVTHSKTAALSDAADSRARRPWAIPHAMGHGARHHDHDLGGHDGFR